MLAHAEQIRNRYEEDVTMEEPERNEVMNHYDGDLIEPMEESVSDSDVSYEGSSSDEIRPRSPLRRTPPRIFSISNRSTRGMKPLHFSEV